MKIAGKSVVVGVTLLATSAFAGTGLAGAQENNDAYVGAEPEVQSEVLFAPEAPAGIASASAGASASAAEVESSTLALTGGDAVALTLVGGAALAGGAGLLVARRRTTS